MSQATLIVVVRWAARVLGTLAAGFVLLIFFGEGGYKAIFRHPEILWVVFPVAGLLLSWRWELIGGLIVAGWLPAFYLKNWLESGRLPGGPWFALIASPSILFLLAWFLARKATQNGAMNGVGH